MKLAAGLRHQLRQYHHHNELPLHPAEQCRHQQAKASPVRPAGPYGFAI
ncbi:MAG TPA: hypothetical protein VFA71_13745 [Terriglobales bacterium]|nr:hypothetical protein [Terriglobales bacterium]